ncbi:MAG: peptide deformylase [bacterium]|nr:peptide deformylase [bacterium]
MKILTVPSPLLRQKSKPVKKIDESVRRLIKEMTVFLLQNDYAVGLSAPQTGNFLRLFALKNPRRKKASLLKAKPRTVPLGGTDTGVTVFINPEIVFSSKKTLLDIKPKEKFLLEGCLSVPGVYAFINRPEKIRIKYLDENGKPHFLTAPYSLAVYLQHEYDHLDGILFIDRAVTQKEKLYRMESDGSLGEI